MNCSRYSSQIILAVFALSIASVAADLKMEPQSTPPEGLPSSFTGLLQQPGGKFLTADGKAWCELWTRKELSKASQPADPTAKYPDLSTGMLVGVMRFPADASDYRGQSIKAGTYTLRYALIPQDGNHMGVSPIRDFLLLVPAEEDNQAADAAIPFNDLMAMSRKTTGTNHPAVILMANPPESDGQPALDKDDLDHWFFKTKIPLKPSGELVVGIVVYGKAES